MRYRRYFAPIAFVLTVLPALLTARPAQAQLNFSLQPADITVRGGTVTTQTYTATLINHYNYDLYLNGDFFTTDAPLSIDDSRFTDYFLLPMDSFGNLLPQPALAANGGSLTVDIFDLTVPVAPDGLYNGVFGIEFGSQPGDTTDTTAANFTVNISQTATPSTPEPGVLALSAALMLCGLAHRTRQSRRQNTVST